MSNVVVDREPFSAESLGFTTVGQVLTHIQQSDRLVVNLLIDGRAPDYSRLAEVRRSPVFGRTLFIETARPREMVLEVLGEVEAQLAQADQFKTQAAEFLQANQISKAMEKLGLCFTTWQAAQESVLKTAQLLRLDVESMDVDGRSLAAVVAAFTTELRDIKLALSRRDFVCLSDMLMYETAQTTRQWSAVIDRLRRAAGAN